MAEDKKTTTKKETTAKEEPAKTKTYKVLKNKNFVGFVHPETRRLVAAVKGKFVVDESDTKAIAILEDAVDVTEV